MTGSEVIVLSYEPEGTLATEEADVVGAGRVISSEQ
jgi:hypothetical protein